MKNAQSGVLIVLFYYGHNPDAFLVIEYSAEPIIQAHKHLQRCRAQRDSLARAGARTRGLRHWWHARRVNYRDMVVHKAARHLYITVRDCVRTASILGHVLTKEQQSSQYIVASSTRCEELFAHIEGVTQYDDLRVAAPA